ncbi:hypothetical protein AURDEDRAFT_177854 [Auricularia subglabra TFB-10046 SS5]|uniref:RlpA-like protein double-psi beta-barrel domain-containing protein n=1 Tax=Auricularia subglabra (strain TFB-10046 / SS5) TaxID=717982 RepID=J0WML9_AURST|nr:hypothetical protein AURDEDRAFT_177854 [Auricularia subglabra TFB-10046 SS5]
MTSHTTRATGLAPTLVRPIADPRAHTAQVFDTYPGAGANLNLNPVCGKQASVSYGGKSITIIIDRCTGSY